MNLKKILSGILGAVLMFVIGNMLPITNLYSHFIVNSHDDENTLVAIVVLVEWPIFIILGAIIGVLAYNYCLTKLSKGRF
ncbi:hypothetical protein [Thalassomonas haliotis]|uniref:Lipopolysaccharide assembly protein A domain-containing protein n=1 Tax=Thalassomonas haliotis TaxID=485448 RepID=A0ABY7VBG3_9GAMM|nr:hypothetical protein [Thalassomonas haliotis]WDE10861.1 hypothetical protein H3N35_21835 [Thalassomonas haliotis]